MFINTDKHEQVQASSRHCDHELEGYCFPCARLANICLYHRCTDPAVKGGLCTKHWMVVQKSVVADYVQNCPEVARHWQLTDLQYINTFTSETQIRQDQLEARRGWQAFGDFCTAVKSAAGYAQAYAAGQGVLPDGTLVSVGEVWQDDGLPWQVVECHLVAGTPAIKIRHPWEPDTDAVDSRPHYFAEYSRRYSPDAHTVPRTYEEYSRMKLRELLKYDARCYPEFAHARLATIVGAIDGCSYSPGRRNIEKLLQALRDYEDARGGRRDPNQEAINSFSDHHDSRLQVIYERARRS